MTNSVNIKNGLNIQPTSNAVSVQGDIASSTFSGNLIYYNGTTSANIVTDTNTLTLSNKSLDAGSNTITNLTTTNLSPSAGIAYSQLTLGGNIVNGDISNAAAITRTKLANATANTVAVNNSSGQLTSATFLSSALGGTGTSNSNSGYIQFNNNIVSFSGSNNYTINFSSTNNTSVTLPTTGTLGTLNGTETLTNKTVGDAITFTEQGSTPSNPASGALKLYAKNSTGGLYALNSSGTESPINVTVAARCTGSSTTLSTATSTVVFTTATIDTNSGYNGSTGIYTVPLAGTYQVYAMLVLGTAGSVSGNGTFIIEHGVTAYTTVPFTYNISNSSFNITASDVVTCSASDTLKITCSVGTNVPTIDEAYLYIVRVGN